MELTVIDYGLSNLLSVQRGIEHCGATVKLTNKKEDILSADALVLPGVGAFKDGMDGLAKLDLIEAIQEKCAQGTPLLGICLGMQMLFDESDEFGLHKGLGLIKGRVELIPNQDTDGNLQRVPNVGWNALVPQVPNTNFDNTILQDTPNGGEMYFVHSYEGKPTDNANRLANTVYGGRNVCAVAKNGNVIGCQFHPEKSGEAGLHVLKEYIKMCEDYIK